MRVAGEGAAVYWRDGHWSNVMSTSSFKIGRAEYVVVPRKVFEKMRKKAELLSDEEAADIAESQRRLGDPKEKRVPWSQVKKRAGIR